MLGIHNRPEFTSIVNALFFRGYEQNNVKPWEFLAETVDSKTLVEVYGILKNIPEMKPWVGDRSSSRLAIVDYALKNVPFESTVNIPKKDAEAGNLGASAMALRMLGNSAARSPSKEVWNLLVAGGVLPCFDGQPYFSTAHPLDNGTTFSNFLSAGTQPNTWWVADLSWVIKPFVAQSMGPPNLEIDQSGTFKTRRIDVGVDYDGAYGFTIPQLMVASEANLDAAGFSAAIEALSLMENDIGELMGLTATHLIYPTALRNEAYELVKPLISGGESNINSNDIISIKHPYL